MGDIGLLSVAWGTAAAARPWNFSEMQMIWLHLHLLIQNLWMQKPEICVFTNGLWDSDAR